MNKKKFDKYKDSTMMTCFYVSLAANWYWVAAAVLAFVANRLWELSLLVPLALLIVWVVSAMISASMIKHASENPMPTEERANVNPYSKSSQEYVKVDKPENKPSVDNATETASKAKELTDEAVAVKKEISTEANAVDEGIASAEEITNPETYGLEIDGQTELDRALEFNVKEELEKVPELIPNGDMDK